MTQVEKLNRVGRLGHVRQRLGSDGPEDETYDEVINKMSNSDCIAKAIGWVLGDDRWWEDYKREFDELEELDKTYNNE